MLKTKDPHTIKEPQYRRNVLALISLRYSFLVALVSVLIGITCPRMVMDLQVPNQDIF
jgi:hypothetical protein